MINDWECNSPLTTEIVPSTFMLLDCLLVQETAVKTWDEAEKKFPNFANAEALDQFVEGNVKKMISSSR